MSASVCPNHPPGHVWDNGLNCRWCDATRTPAEAIVSGLASRRGGNEEAARTLLGAYRAEVLASEGAVVEGWPGELGYLRALITALNKAVQMNNVQAAQRLLAVYQHNHGQPAEAEATR
ncbi:hypothetical protein [Streptomyces cupreus]|uniref:Uncharacterized protein n=1 Tax=Streptomyces cupreus TaxID=2759956 RepID=A0A7X1MA00_9ACTN|nr:hypothetical protein [Streptomyces cupreus]MBC2903203.1 hypothetical protein [Streptomyces cupreus]